MTVMKHMITTEWYPGGDRDGLNPAGGRDGVMLGGRQRWLVVMAR